MESRLGSIDSQHYRWALICPTCLIEFGGVVKKKGWLQFDPVCPGCQHTIAGFTNPCWPPALSDAERLEAQRMLRAEKMNSMPTITGIWDEFVEFIMWVCCSVLDFINAALRWTLVVVGSYDEEIE